LRQSRSDDADEVLRPSSASAFTNDYTEARAAGREAFWHGRPIWANPLIGGPARDWTAGWKRGATELAARRSESKLPTSASELRQLLTLHRPDDVAPPPRQPRPYPVEATRADA
jgi:hypothetical protein